MKQEFTHQDAFQYVIDSLGYYVDEFNIDACIDDLYVLAGGSYDFRCIDPEKFYKVVQKHDTAGEIIARDMLHN